MRAKIAWLLVAVFAIVAILLCMANNSCELCDRPASLLIYRRDGTYLHLCYLHGYCQCWDEMSEQDKKDYFLLMAEETK